MSWTAGASHVKKEPRATANSFFDWAVGEPNDREVLFESLLLLQGAQRARELGKLQLWAKDVLRDEARAEELQQEWKPLDVAVWEPLRAAYAQQWLADDLDAIGAAMQLWRGKGQRDGLTHVELRHHKSAQLKGTPSAAQKRRGKAATPPRWHTT